MEKDCIINIENLSFSYTEGRKVIDSLDFKLFKGDRIGLIAPNGSGKTTFFYLIMGLLKPKSGSIEVFGNKIKEEKDFLMVRRRIGLLFQDADDQLFCPTVIEDVAFGPLNLGKTKKEAIDISLETLKSLGIEKLKDRITFKLSGGEKRMVSLAAVMAMSPDVLLLDEPATGLDQKTKEKLAQILASLDMSIIVISHQLDFLSAINVDGYTMKDGKIQMENKLCIHKHFHAHKLGGQPHEHCPKPAKISGGEKR